MSKGQSSPFIDDVTHDRVHRTTDHVKYAAEYRRDAGLHEIFLQSSNSDIASVDRIRTRVISQFG